MDPTTSSTVTSSATKDTIDGLKILVSGQELADHLREKAQVHDRKAGEYAEQVEAIEKIGDNLANQSNDPRKGLADHERTHRTRAQLFTFMADHVVLTADYLLDEQDLIRVEIMDRGW